MADLWILDKEDNLLAILSSQAESACIFWNAMFREELNQGSTFSFTCDATHPDSQHVTKLNQVVFKDKDGFFRLFKIREVDSGNGEEGAEKTAQCEPAEMELLEWIIDDVRPYKTTQKDVLDRALAGTRWTGNVTADLGINSTHFYHISAYEAIKDIIKVWGGELKFTVTFDTKNNNVIERVVNIIQRRGSDDGGRFEVGYNIESIHVTEMAYPVSALYGWGASVETQGGNSRYINFADVEWKVSNGDPVDKPKGQKWVEFPPAKERYGHKKTDGTIINAFGKWQDENIEDPKELLQKTFEYLVHTASNTQTNYALEVFLLDEPVSLGDTRLAIDRTVSEPIKFFGRVIVLEYDISDPEGTAKVEMGQFLEVYEPDKRLDEIEEKIRDIEQEKGNTIVTDDSFPDKKPPMPQNVEVKGLFSKVALSWDFEPYSYIAKYEVYGSQMKDFTPDITNRSNLLWAGKEGGTVHEVEVNQLWYYRIRAVNTHGTASDFTAQYSAATVRIGTNHIEDLAITNTKIGKAAIDTLNVADGAITNAKINSLIADKIKGGILSGVIVRSDNESGDTIELKDGALTSILDGKTMIKMSNYNLYFYDSGTDASSPKYDEVGTISNSWGGSNSSRRGFSINGTKDYLSFGKNTGAGSGKYSSFLDSDFGDRTTVLGGAVNESGKWNGSLELRSAFQANWGNGNGSNTYVPKIFLDNYNDSRGTKWANCAIYTGRGPDAPNDSDERFGFEVWQYLGHGSEAKQLLKIDKSSSDGHYMGFWGDTAFLPYNTVLEAGNDIKISTHGLGVTVSSAVEDSRGALNYNAVLRIHYWNDFFINQGSGSTAYGDGTLDIGSNIENLFWAVAVPYGSYSDCVTVGISSMAAGDHFIKFRVRGSGAVNVENKTLSRLMIAYLYEPK
ncbi:phage tail protein [Bacillus sp. CLL-7-23]|uniref:Phage tail protein n=1 Tax=Bacillus changyiensis TaxID=3004103 RepID=A0ABT4X8B4_9BACI|nr:phage tail spike protein [Bacillus changyiensis]MDA1477262.1 phage tail protein [Bacillus changyiensis]MDA7028530.1 phage tail protein [Bacillus changyiensis]